MTGSPSLKDSPLVKIFKPGCDTPILVYKAITDRYKIKDGDTIDTTQWSEFAHITTGYTLAYEDARLHAIGQLMPTYQILGQPVWLLAHKYQGICPVVVFVDICVEHGVKHMDALDHDTFVKLFNANAARFAQLQNANQPDLNTSQGDKADVS